MYGVTMKFIVCLVYVLFDYTPRISQYTDSKSMMNGK